MSTGALHCPTCGAADSDTSGSERVAGHRCKYCGTRLATVQCASCFGLLFVGSRFCPHCGAAAATKKPAHYEKLFCPRCRTPSKKPLMEPAVLRDVDLDECPQCAGVWIDHATFTRIIASAAAQADVLELLGPARGTAERVVRYVRCPLCDEQMARRNYARRSGVIVDFCPSHGLWFDAEELRRVIEFIRTGGLAEARAADIEAAEVDVQRRKREGRVYGDEPFEAEQTSRSEILERIVRGLRRV